MRSKKYPILLFVFLFFQGMDFLSAQQTVQCLAVITEINGKALFKEAGMNQFVKANWGTRLYNGDQIETGDKSEVKLLFSDKSFIVVGQNSKVTLSGEKASLTQSAGEVKEISTTMGVNLSSLSFRKGNEQELGALAGYRSISGGMNIEPDLPLNTIIRTDRPSFSWITRTGFESYTVNLYNSSGLVWSKRVKEKTMQYPEGEDGLKSGATYFWNVEGESGIETEKSANHSFTVISQDKAQEIAQREVEIRKTFEADPEGSSIHSILGACYIEQGLLQDAIHEFQQIAKINPDAPLPHEILGSLYSDSGEKDKAIEELQKALRLTSDNDN
jgi:hypothetical protein